ncbi:MAG TPA: Nif3-like dinuclear metal center hexameric protein [Clostridiales bacterium]|nr:Nif3-like dinuclear metal center hexameric protein [Clostridiales bacterium]
MTTVKAIYDFIDEIAPFDSAMSFDNVGILAGDVNAQVTTAVVALDVTKAVIAEAEQQQAQLIISHHPIIFTPLKALKSNTIPYLLAQKGINVISAHTNLDLSEKGVNTCLAKALQLNSIKLTDNEAMATGTLSIPMSAATFASYVKDKLHCTGVRYTVLDKAIYTVAVSSGAGGDNIYLAKAMGADVLVTGEIKHNYIIESIDEDIAIVDAGHYRTEDVVIKPLCDILNTAFADVTFLPSTAFTDKIKYIL